MSAPRSPNPRSMPTYYMCGAVYHKSETRSARKHHTGEEVGNGDMGWCRVCPKTQGVQCWPGITSNSEKAKGNGDPKAQPRMLQARQILKWAANAPVIRRYRRKADRLEDMGAAILRCITQCVERSQPSKHRTEHQLSADRDSVPGKPRRCSTRSDRRPGTRSERHRAVVVDDRDGSVI